ncbi:MAG: CopD family protein [Candidatus Rokubacteria bacterium]|nr:CopD family protein [Candidatus Rokubacteria bacterium]
MFLAATIVRWLSLASLAALIGGLTVESLLPRADDASPRTVDLDLRRWTGWAAWALLLATVAELVIRVQILTGSFAVGAVPIVLDRTHFGRIWSGRLASLLLVGLMLWFRKRRVGLLTKALALGIAWTTVVTGHAGNWGDLSYSVLIDAGHVVASTAWVGGLFCLALLVFPNRHRWGDERLGIVLWRFSRLAGICLAIVVATGSYNGWVQLQSWSALWSTRYGAVLLVKLGLIVGLVCFGALNRYALLPHLGRLRRSIAWEAILALLVFGCTAMLGELTPGRHAAHLSRGAHEDHQ